MSYDYQSEIDRMSEQVMAHGIDAQLAKQSLEWVQLHGSPKEQKKATTNLLICEEGTRKGC